MPITWMQKKYKGISLVTDNGDDMFNMKVGDSIMWYYSSGNREPACKFNTLNLNIDY